MCVCSLCVYVRERGGGEGEREGRYRYNFDTFLEIIFGKALGILHNEL